MDIKTIAETLKLKVWSEADNMNKKVSGCYTGDLLSDVMANSQEGDIWITRQVHQNIVAVASLKDHAAIILVNSCEPSKETLERAKSEKVVIMTSSLSTFELTGRIYNLLATKE